MIRQLFPSTFKSSWKHYLVFALAGIYVLLNLFRIGGDAFVFNLNNNIVSPLALGVTVLAVILWRGVVGGENRWLWTGLTIGWALWTVAELWWAVAALIGQEVPYPSWADFFWLVGYLPMFIALWVRIRSLPRNFTAVQKTGMWISMALTVGWTIFFVLIPIIQSNDPSAVLESVLNILYPLVDLVILVLVLQIFFTYQQGMSGWAWAWLSIGFIIHSLSNLIFSYASNVELYYPNGQANLLSTMGIDVPYNLSYLFWLVGLFILRSVYKSYRTFADIYVSLTPLPNAHFLVFTKGDDTVSSVSQNFTRLFFEKAFEGAVVSDVIECAPEAAKDILGVIKEKNITTEQAVLVKTRLGPQQALISGVSTSGPREPYSGTILLLRLFTDDYSLDGLLTDYQRGLVRSLLGKMGIKEDEAIKRLLSDYTLAFLLGFYKHSFVEGGNPMAAAFIADLQSAAKLRGSQVEIRPEALLDVSTLTLAETREILPVLYETARQFVVRISGESTAESIAQNARSRFDAAVLKNVAYFEQNKEKFI